MPSWVGGFSLWIDIGRISEHARIVIVREVAKPGNSGVPAVDLINVYASSIRIPPA